MKAKTVGAVATQYKDPAIGVEGMVCVVQWSQDGRILVTDVMGHLEEQPNMNVFQNQHQVNAFSWEFYIVHKRISKFKGEYKKKIDFEFL